MSERPREVAACELWTGRDQVRFLDPRRGATKPGTRWSAKPISAQTACFSLQARSAGEPTRCGPRAHGFGESCLEQIARLRASIIGSEQLPAKGKR